MATGDSILEGLGGMQFSPLENPYGIGAATLATSLPKLINPSGNFGTNLGIALGGTLLTSLMGYQARSTAADLSSRSTQLGLDIMAAQTPEQRMTLANAADTGMYGPEVKSKALNLVSALESQRKINALAAQQQYDTKLKELEAMISPEGEKYMKMQTDRMLEGIGARGENAVSLEKIKQANRLANMAKAAEIKGNLGWLNNKQKLALDKQLREAEANAINLGVDPELLRDKIFADYKATIDKNKMDAEQANHLQRIKFTKDLEASNLSIPKSEQDNLAVARSVASRAYDIAKYIKEQNSYYKTMMGTTYSAYDDESLKERIKLLQADFNLAKSGKAVSNQEAARLQAIIEGDWTAGIESKADNLISVADAINEEKMIFLGNLGKSPTDVYNTFAKAVKTKQFELLPTTLPEKEAPQVPTPASAGMSLSSSLSGSNPDMAAKISIDEARIKQQASEEVARLGYVTEETKKAAIQLKATKQELGL